MLRKFVIHPVRSVWPQVIPTFAMNRALIVMEKQENGDGCTIWTQIFLNLFGSHVLVLLDSKFFLHSPSRFQLDGIDCTKQLQSWILSILCQ